MRTYGMSYRSLMSMPVKAFWTISGFVERVLMDEQKLVLEVTAASHDGEAAQSLMERLQEQAPHPVKYTGRALAQVGAERDESGFASLRAMQG
jgi:hypothetical protein